MLTRGKVIEPLGHFARSNLEQMLVQRAAPACPHLDFQRTRPRKQHIAVLDDVFWFELGTGLVRAAGVAGAQLRDLDNR